MQWRIRDFPGVPAPNVDVKRYYLAKFFPKHFMKLKEFGPEGGIRVPGAP